MSGGATVSLALGQSEDPEVIAYVPAGTSLRDLVRICEALAEVFPDAVAKTADLPPGMAMAVLRRA